MTKENKTLTTYVKNFIEENCLIQFHYYFIISLLSLRSVCYCIIHIHNTIILFILNKINSIFYPLFCFVTQKKKFSHNEPFIKETCGCVISIQKRRKRDEKVQNIGDWWWDCSQMMSIILFFLGCSWLRHQPETWTWQEAECRGV